MNSNIKAAGGIVIKNKNVLFIYKNGKWDLPKGKIEQKLNKRNTALNEISEETGLPEDQLYIIKKLIPTYHHKIIEGKTIIKKTYWYLVGFKGEYSTPLVPDQNEGITECRWFDFDELMVVIEKSQERIRYLIEFFLNTPFYKNHRAQLAPGQKTILK